MDKIYVEGKLPKCCLMCTLECPEEQRCVDGFTRDCENCDVSDRPKTCPLRPLSKRLAEERKTVCDAVYKLTRELLSFGFKTVSIEDVENVIKQFDEEE